MAITLEMLDEMSAELDRISISDPASTAILDRLAARLASLAGESGNQEIAGRLRNLSVLMTEAATELRQQGDDSP